jgi:hypothetical protein
MSFLDDVRTGGSFRYYSSGSLGRAEMNFDNYLSLIRLPYYDLNSNLRSIAHPFCHALQLIYDAGRFVYGAFVLVVALGALATGQPNAASQVAFHMLKLVGAAVLEVLNIALSIVSLATRFLASLWNIGYVSTRFIFDSAPLRNCEMGGRNAETTSNMLLGSIFMGSNQIARAVDEAGHQSAFKLV